ncbi:hypothetical protein BJ912DRAFT_1078050, partial [Pholiota molesta]
DILIAIKPDNMNYIVKRTKNHEFRKYFISNMVERMCANYLAIQGYLYVSSPDKTLRYIAPIGHGKVPGKIEKEDGVGKADFNAGLENAVAAYAYEITEELYQLKEPLTLAEMQATYRVTFPQRFFYVSDRMIEDIVLEDQIRLF